MRIKFNYLNSIKTPLIFISHILFVTSLFSANKQTIKRSLHNVSLNYEKKDEYKYHWQEINKNTFEVGTNILLKTKYHDSKYPDRIGFIIKNSKTRERISFSINNVNEKSTRARISYKINQYKNTVNTFKSIKKSDFHKIHAI